MPHRLLLLPNHTSLVLVDVQERLAAAMGRRQEVVQNILLLIQTACRLGIPIVHTEQYPKGLGLTVPEVASLLKTAPIEKTTFNCCAVESFLSALKRAGTKRVILAGMEAHVCVAQTALDLIYRGHDVHVPVDAVCSRHEIDWEYGIRKIERAGGVLTTTETAIFELLGKADTDVFRAVSRLIKQARPIRGIGPSAGEEPDDSEPSTVQQELKI